MLLQLIIPLPRMGVDELLTKGAIESSTGGAVFYSDVFCVVKFSGDL